MMYTSYIMRRTQIYLTTQQGRFLEARSRATGRTISELIRAAIDATYGAGRQMTRANRVHIARRTAGAWHDFPESGAEYVEGRRTGRRLARSHGNR